MEKAEILRSVMENIPDLDLGEKISGILDPLLDSIAGEIAEAKANVEAITAERDEVRAKYIDRFLNGSDPGNNEQEQEQEQEEQEQETEDENENADLNEILNEDKDTEEASEDVTLEDVLKEE